MCERDINQHYFPFTHDDISPPLQLRLCPVKVSLLHTSPLCSVTNVCVCVWNNSLNVQLLALLQGSRVPEEQEHSQTHVPHYLPVSLVFVLIIPAG